MSPEEFARVDRIFQLARRARGDERDRIIEAEAGGDPALLAEVRALLAEHDRGLDALASPALGPGFSLVPGDAPRIIAGYRVLSVLGEGGMGTVYLAEQAEPRRRVALKLVRGGFASEDVLRRFRREADALAQLHHPGIAQVYAAGMDGETPFIAMEHVEGRSLLDFAETSALDRDARLQLFCRVADAVHHAHLRGIIHRDLKPSNILVEGSWPKAWPKVLDFGVARVQSDPAPTVRTRAGELIGTVQYMSPEQAAGDPALDERADVYALGVILFELLSGQRPHDLATKSVVEAARVLHDEEPRRLGSIDPTLRGPLDAVTATALARDLRERYPSVAALAEDVRRFLMNEPVSAVAGSAKDLLRRFARRNRSLLIGGSAVAAALVLGLLATLWQWRSAIRARDAERQAKLAAERRFSDVRELARAFVFDFHDLVEPLPGSLQARRFLVSTGLAYLDRLATEGDLDDPLARELAAAYAQLGDIQGAPNLPNLGDLTGARSSYRRALELLENLTDPTSPDARDDRYKVMVRIGDVSSAMKRPEEAMDWYRRCEPLLPPTPPAGDSDRRRGTLAARMGNALLGLARIAEARPYFETALGESRARYESDPTNDGVARDYATDLFKLAMCDNAEGHAEAALAGFSRYFDLVTTLAARKPDDPIHRRDLKVGHDRIAEALLALNRSDEALPHLVAAVELSRGPLESSPDDLQAYLDHSGALVRLGEQRLATGDLDGAASSFEAALALAQSPERRDHSDPRARRRLAVVRYKMSELERALADASGPDDADRVTHLESARGWLEGACQVFDALAKEGLLPASDADALADLNTELDAVREGLSGLRGD